MIDMDTNYVHRLKVNLWDNGEHVSPSQTTDTTKPPALCDSLLH